MSASLHLITRILKVYIKALTGFNNVCNPNGLSSTLLSQGSIFEMAPSVERGFEHAFQGQEGVRSL